MSHRAALFFEHVMNHPRTRRRGEAPLSSCFMNCFVSQNVCHFEGQTASAPLADDTKRVKKASSLKHLQFSTYFPAPSKDLQIIHVFDHNLQTRK